MGSHPTIIDQAATPKRLYCSCEGPSRHGIVLLMTLVVLLVLATLVCNLASRVAAQRRRNSYIIDYAVACYARDSAVKYALTTLQDLNDIQLVSRPNEPDFSDLFTLSETDYRGLLAQWAEELARGSTELAEVRTQGGPAKDQSESLGDSNNQPTFGDANNRAGLGLQDLKKFGGDANIKEILDFDENTGVTSTAGETNAIDLIRIRGPYGPPWPFVAEPVEFEIGSAKVKIEMEDENAKYPLGWATLEDANVQQESQASLDTFCEWMGLDAYQVDSLKGQLKQVGSIKPFKVDFKPVTQKTPVTTTIPSTRRRGVRRQQTSYQAKSVSPAEQLTKQTRDFCRLFHSSIIDTEMLAAPTIMSEDRKESALKYMDLWGASQVNINSAPRQVLEAAFTFGGDAEQIASEIIKKRREKPFASIEDLKKEFFRFSDTIEKSKPYITAASNVFTIRVTAVSGVAKASAVIVVFKDGGKIERVAVASG